MYNCYNPQQNYIPYYSQPPVSLPSQSELLYPGINSIKSDAFSPHRLGYMNENNNDYHLSYVLKSALESYANVFNIIRYDLNSDIWIFEDRKEESIFDKDGDDSSFYKITDNVYQYSSNKFIITTFTKIVDNKEIIHIQTLKAI